MSNNNEMKFRRGEIVYVDLGNVMGSEQGGKRPAVILSNDKGNEHSEMLIIAPITTKFHRMPTHVEVMLARKSYVLLEQIRTISKDRVVNKTDYQLDEKKMKEINVKLMIALGIE